MHVATVPLTRSVPVRRASFALLAVVPRLASLAAARPRHQERGDVARAEVARVRAHFDSVDAELRARRLRARRRPTRGAGAPRRGAARLPRPRRLPARSADNRVRVAALAGDTAFRAWLDGAGLTLPEPARIQQSYAGPDGDDDVPSSVITGVATALGGITIGVNLAARADAPGRGWRVGSGLAAGAVNLALT